LKKSLVPGGSTVILNSFWGEQKPVVAIAATGFNFYGVRGFSNSPTEEFLVASRSCSAHRGRGFSKKIKKIGSDLLCKNQIGSNLRVG
jgi:hypothetical protein